MLIAGVDIETTGLLGPDGTPGDQRIVEVYAGFWDLTSRVRRGAYFSRINPLRSIAPAAQAVHKISIADLEGKPTWEDVGPDFRRAIEPADLIVWHNGDGFDGPFIDGELKRIKQPVPNKPSFDTMLRGRCATAMGTVPSLAQLCWSFGVPYDASAAHAAEYDVEVMMQAFFNGLDWGHFKLEAPATAIAA